MKRRTLVASSISRYYHLKLLLLVPVLIAIAVIITRTPTTVVGAFVDSHSKWRQLRIIKASVPITPVDTYSYSPSALLLSRKKKKYQHDDTNTADDDRDESTNNKNGHLHHRHEEERRRFLRDLVLSAAGTITTTAVTNLLPNNSNNMIALAAKTTTTATNSNKYLVPTPPNTGELSWPLGKIAFSLLPLAGTSTRRATCEACIVPDVMWTHDQIQGVVNVNVPVRQTVVRLSSDTGGGGLWVHNPVAPTPQLLQMMQRLIDKYGPVRHIVLGTVALEHKATFGDFCSHYPDATVWIQPGQYSFPINTGGPELYGLRQRGPRLREIPVIDEVTGQPLPVSKSYQYYGGSVPEWTSDFDYEVLGPFSFKSVGGFSETAFYHKSTKSLILTDTVVSVTKDPPPIIEEDPRALLFHARDKVSDKIEEDTPALRRKGWRRMVQFGLVFFPSQITIQTAGQALGDTKLVPAELRNLGVGAVPGGLLYPWEWKEGDADLKNFEAISENGKPFCPPILTKLILDREPTATLAWVDRVSTRFKDMERIVPCHLDNNIKVKGSRSFYEAFDPLRSQPSKIRPQRALAEDLALLQGASDVLTKYGIVAPSQVCDGEEGFGLARLNGRFAS